MFNYKIKISKKTSISILNKHEIFSIKRMNDVKKKTQIITNNNFKKIKTNYKNR